MGVSPKMKVSQRSKSQSMPSFADSLAIHSLPASCPAP
jgi:hypothetical protein